MAPGNWNGKNFGGLHTGTGKYQKGGPYSMNGQRFKKIPNYKFEVDRLVKYIGTHKDFIHAKGRVVSKVGDKQKALLKKALLDPFARGIRDLNAAKQTLSMDYSGLKKQKKL